MQSFIQYLIEKRSNPDKNVKQHPLEQLYKYANNADGLYASYTAIDKIGINPQSSKKYNTPIGVYTYHLPYMLKRMDRTKRMSDVPYMGDQPYVWIIKPTTPVLVLQQYTASDLEADKAKLIKALGKNAEVIKDIEDTIESYTKLATRQIPPVIMWNITRGLAKENPHKWNHILRVILGYNVIRDDGGSIIHGNEPYQCVFLSIRAIKAIERINKKLGSGDPQNSEFSRKRSELLATSVTDIKQSCQIFLRSKNREDFDTFIEHLNNVAEEFANFKIEIALGAKMFKQLKETIMAKEDLYFMLHITSIIDIKEFDDVISNDPELILKMVNIIKNNYEPGEKTIAKSQQYSIKYIDLLTTITKHDPILYLSYKSSKEFKEIVTQVLNDENQLNKRLSLYGVDYMYDKFKHLNIPKIRSIHDDGEYNELKELTKTFFSEKDSHSLTDLCEYYETSKKISDDDWEKLLQQIGSLLYNDSAIFSGLNALLRIFPDKRIDAHTMNRLIYGCIDFIHGHKNNNYVKRILNELLYRCELANTLKSFMRGILANTFDAHELKTLVRIFKEYMANSFSGDYGSDSDEINEIISKYDK